MKKIAILGCENSHADTFLTFLRDKEDYRDVEVVGVYSDERPAAERLHDLFGVPILDQADAAVGLVDGVVITARNGARHAPLLTPYLATVKAAFIDKPITISEEEALLLVRECRKKRIRLSGGSCLKYAAAARSLGEAIREGTGGATLSGIVRAPVSFDNAYGGFFFYSEHLVALLGTAFGRYPTAVTAHRTENVTTVLFHYPQYDVVGLYTEGVYTYSLTRHTESAVQHEEITPGEDCFLAEWNEFYGILSGGDPHDTEEDLIAPVFILNAIHRSLQSGQRECVHRFTV